MSLSNREKNITGVILAGGENRRFRGETKANLIVDGRPIIENTLAILTGIFADVIIVTNKSSDFAGYSNYRQIPDIFKRVGPLGGIHAALRATSLDAIFVIAGDMPWLSENFIREVTNYYLLSDCEVLIPRKDGFDEPLHAIYSLSVYKRLDKFLTDTDKYAIKDFLNQTKVEYMTISSKNLADRVFTNINTPADLKTFENRCLAWKDRDLKNSKTT